MARRKRESFRVWMRVMRRRRAMGSFTLLTRLSMKRVISTSMTLPWLRGRLYNPMKKICATMVPDGSTGVIDISASSFSVAASRGVVISASVATAAS